MGDDAEEELGLGLGLVLEEEEWRGIDREIGGGRRERGRMRWRREGKGTLGGACIGR